EGLKNSAQSGSVHRKWETGLEIHDSIDLPAAENQVGGPSDVTEEMFAPSYGELVNEAADEVMWRVVACVRIIQPRIVSVQRSDPPGRIAVHARRARFYIQVFRPGIAGKQRAASSSVLDFNVGGMVI